MKYFREVYEDVKEFHKENFGEFLTDYDIDLLPRTQVLNDYLSWNGIYGYNRVIIDILLGEDLWEQENYTLVNY